MTMPELLAPAGSAEALHAAVSAGADAVYLGLDRFNARRNAANFSGAAFAEACDYAHLRACRVYVALNTLVLPDEMDDALACAREAYLAGADAFIVQDIGLAALLADAYGGGFVHISTQMNIHSASGVRAAAALGAARVTLARELSLDEVARAAGEARDLGMEVEVFAHGALCICYSGQCLMSSLIGGRSANRGLCAQACRLPYELAESLSPEKRLKAPGEYLLSPRDLCTIDRIADLARAGVASLKIEGRMKSPEYVRSVVAVYRAALDRLAAAGREGATDEERTALADAFTRGFTTAYLTGERYDAMMGYQRPNNRGVHVGRVRAVEGDVARIACERELKPGDLLEFWTRAGHVAVTVAETVVHTKKEVRLPLGEAASRIRPADRVFRVRSADAAFVDDPSSPRIAAACDARLRLAEPVRIAFRTLSEDEIPESDAVGRGVARRTAGLFEHPPAAAFEGEAVEAARSKAVTPAEVEEHIGRMGSTPFSLASFTCDIDEGVGISFSKLHKGRACALDALSREMLAAWAERRPKAPRRASRLGREGRTPRLSPSVAAVATNPECARAARRHGAQTVYIPALNYQRGQAEVGGCLERAVSQTPYPKKPVLMMPAIDHDACGASREALLGESVWRHVEAGSEVLVESVGALVRALELDARVQVGPMLPVTNADALDVVARMGARLVWLSPELNLDQVRELARTAAVPLGIKVAGAQQVMVCEHCILSTGDACTRECDACQKRRRPHVLHDRKGYDFPVVSDRYGRSHIYNSVQTDLVPSIGRLLDAGVTTFVVDTTLMDAERASQAVSRAVRALEGALAGEEPPPKLPNATTGHLYRGVL